MPATKNNLKIMINALRHEKDASCIHIMTTRGIFDESPSSSGFESGRAYFAGLHPEECYGGEILLAYKQNKTLKNKDLQSILQY